MTDEYEPPPQINITENASTSAIWRRWFFGLWRTVEGNLNHTVSVKDFGAVGDGVTDDTAAIQAAIDYIETLTGGEVYFPQGVYFISSTLEIGVDNVYLKGAGGGGFQAGITPLRNSAASRLRWDGATSATAAMVEFRTPENTNSKSSGGLEGLQLDCQNTCGVGLRLVSWNFGDFNNFVVYGATSKAVQLTTSALTLSANPYDCYKNSFRNVFTTCKNLSANGSSGLHMDRDAASPGSGNCAFNTFINCTFGRGELETGDGVFLGNSDNNTFYAVNAATMVFGIGADLSVSRYNMAYGCEVNVTAKASQVGGSSSYRNTLIGLNKSNAKGVVTIETGAGGSDDATLYVQWVDGTYILPQKTPINGAVITSDIFNDGYQEGTWTPNVEGKTTAGTVSYTNRYGHYTRVGNVVTIEGYTNYNSLTGTGDLLITGLPYEPSNDKIIHLAAQNLVFAGQLFGKVDGGTSEIRVRGFTTGATATNIQVDAAAFIWINASYTIE